MAQRRFRLPNQTVATAVISSQLAGFAIACLLPSVVFAQATSPVPPATATAPIAPEPTSLALPYHAMACHGGPLLALSIDGAPNQWFLADTANSTTWLSVGTPERLHLNLTPYAVNGVAQTDGNGKAIQAAHIKLGIGTLSTPLDVLLDNGWLNRIYADIDAAEKLEGGSRLFGGILGTNILRYYAVELDPSQQELRLSSGDMTDDYLKKLGFSGGLASGIPIAVDPTTGLATVSVTLSDDSPTPTGDASKPAAAPVATTPIPMTLDTGTFQTCVPSSVAGQFKSPPLIRFPDLAAPGGGPIDIHSNTSLHLGNTTLSHFTPGVSTATDGKVGVLGMDYLAHFRVLIDFPKQRLYLEPLPSVALYDNPSLRENATRFIGGHLLQPSASGDWYLKVAPPASPFSQLGILPTDKLVAVDEVTLSGKPSLEVTVLLYKAQSITISRHGQQIHLTLPTQSAQ